MLLPIINAVKASDVEIVAYAEFMIDLVGVVKYMESGVSDAGKSGRR